MIIYAARVKDMEREKKDSLIAMLDSNRRDKVHKLKIEAERNRSIYAGLLLRYAFLEANNSQEWQQIQVEQGEYGKPRIKGYDTFHYSLSHSGDWVVCGVDDMELGIDIQQMRPYQKRLAERFYHKREYQRLCEAEDEELRRKQFYQMWAAKESYVKLTGRGIGAGIDRYLTDENYRQITDETQSQSAFLKIYDMDTDYVVSACSCGNAFPQQITIVEDEIMMRA